ncbi:MAG TPA: hypothetical protein VF815_34845 [Myxococcaceae bacterium]|jgi:hypothetical protein
MADALSAFQRALLEAFFRRAQSFYLTGGAALAGFYLGHRRIPGSLSVEELRAALESLIHRLTLLAAPPNRG